MIAAGKTAPDEAAAALRTLRGKRRLAAIREGGRPPTPGATETVIFETAASPDSHVGGAGKDRMAATGFTSMVNGDGAVVGFWHGKPRSVTASVTPAGLLAKALRRVAQPR